MLQMSEVHKVYENTGSEALRGVDLTINDGEFVFLVGPSGSGKTTIINLLTRMYEPTSGKIFLGTENVSELSLSEYRNMVSVVSQQIYLFNDTIRNNICLYKRVDDVMIEAACKDSGLEDFIKEVSLDHVVGQNGAMLSGGQKQRISIARAFLKNPPILILDEATSALDSQTEVAIQKSFEELARGRTTIAIAHRLSTLRNMDRIIVLKNGRIVESGTHNALLRRGGEYARLWKLQSGGFLPE